MFNFEITSPIYLGFLVVYFFSSAIRAFIDDFRERDAGMLESGKIVYEQPERPLPKWSSWIVVFDWIIVIVLLLLNPVYTIVAWLIMFGLKKLPPIKILGRLLLKHFRPAPPADLSDEHLAVANAIRIQSHKEEPHLPDSSHYLQIVSKIDSLKLANGSRTLLSKALDYLQAESFAKKFPIKIEENKIEIKLEKADEEVAEVREKRNKIWEKQEKLFEELNAIDDKQRTDETRQLAVKLKALSNKSYELFEEILEEKDKEKKRGLEETEEKLNKEIEELGKELETFDKAGRTEEGWQIKAKIDKLDEDLARLEPEILEAEIKQEKLQIQQNRLSLETNQPDLNFAKEVVISEKLTESTENLGSTMKRLLESREGRLREKIERLAEIKASDNLN